MKTTAIAALGATFLAAGFARSATVQVDPDRSRIHVDAKATGHEFTGELKKYTLKAEGNSATGSPSALDLSWDFNDLKTGDEKRDKEMIKWLGGGKPKGAFSFRKSWEETANGGKAMGNLTVNGVTKSVAFPYTLKRDGEWVTMDGSVSMDYQDFKLAVVRAMMVMTVDPKLVVRFHIVGKLE